MAGMVGVDAVAEVVSDECSGSCVSDDAVAVVIRR